MIDESTDKQILQKFHDQIFQMVNARLTETFRFYAPLLSGLTAYGLVLWQFMDKNSGNSNLPNIYSHLLDSAYVLGMLLLLIGVFYVFTVSYTYRCLQIVLAKLEESLELKKHTLDWDPRNKLSEDDWKSRPWRILTFWMVPEILKAHLFMFLAGGIAVSYAHNEHSPCLAWTFFAFSLIVGLGIHWWYFRKLKKA